MGVEGAKPREAHGVQPFKTHLEGSSGTDFFGLLSHSKICLWVEFSCIWEKAEAFYRIYGELELILG